MTVFLSLTTLIFLSGFGYFGYRAYILAGLLADQQDSAGELETYIKDLEDLNQYMYSKIDQSYTMMQEIDRLGAFEKDDEAGTTFQLLNEVITTLKMEFDAESEEN
jgi:hypothetical protein